MEHPINSHPTPPHKRPTPRDHPSTGHRWTTRVGKTVTGILASLALTLSSAAVALASPPEPDQTGQATQNEELQSTPAPPSSDSVEAPSESDIGSAPNLVAPRQSAPENADEEPSTDLPPNPPIVAEHNTGPPQALNTPTAEISITRDSVSPQLSGVPFDYIIMFSCQAVASDGCENSRITIPLDPSSQPSMVPTGLPAAEQWKYEVFGNDNLAPVSTLTQGNEQVIRLPPFLESGESYSVRLRVTPPRGFTANGQTWSLLPTFHSDSLSDPVEAPLPADGEATATPKVMPLKVLATGNQTIVSPGDLVQYKLVARCHTSVWTQEGMLYLSQAYVEDTLPEWLTFDADNSTEGAIQGSDGTIRWNMDKPNLPISCGGTRNDSGNVAGDTIFNLAARVNNNAPDGAVLLNTLKMTGLPIGENQEISDTATHQLEVDAYPDPWPERGGVAKQTAGTIQPRATYAGNWIRPISPEPRDDNSVEALFVVSTDYKSLGFTSRIEDPLPCLDNSPEAGEYRSLAPGNVCLNPAFHTTVVGIGEWNTHGTNDYKKAYEEGWRPRIVLADAAGTVIPLEKTSEGTFGPWVNGAFFAVPEEYVGQVASVLLEPNDNIAGSRVHMRINGYADASLPDNARLYNTATVTAYRPNGDVADTRSAEDYLDILPNRVQAGASKSVQHPQVEPSGAQRLTLTARANSPTPFNGPIVVTDLLPTGYTYTGSTSSLAVTTSHNGETKTSLQGDVEVIDDFQATGRQLLRVTIDPPEATFAGGAWSLAIHAYVKAPDIAGRDTNTTQVFLPEQTIHSACSASTYSASNPLDLLGDGNLEAPHCEASAGMNVISNGAPGFAVVKSVQGDVDPAPRTFPHVGVVEPIDGHAKYRLTWRNIGGGSLTDVVVYDVLPYVGDVSVISGQPRGSEFRPVLQSIEAAPAGVVIEYATVPNACQPEIVEVQVGCVENAWSTSLPAGGLSEVRALRLSTQPGVEYESGQSFSVGFEMSTPDLNPVNQIAWNNATSHAWYAAATELLPMAPAEEPKVGLQGLSPGIDIIKADSLGNDGDDPDAPVIIAPETPTDLVFTVTNTGNVPLVDVEITDQVLKGSATVDGLSCDFANTGTYLDETSWEGPLPIGGSFICRATLSELPPEQLHHNEANATGIVAGRDHPVEDTDDFFAFNNGTPDIAVVKRVFGTEAREAPGPHIRVGTDVAWTYEVTTGAGDVSLGDVTVTDDNGTPDDPSDDWQAVYLAGDTNDNNRLDVDETWIFTTPPAHVFAATAGPYSNKAVAQGTPPSNDPVEATDWAFLFGAEPDISLVKYTQSIFDANGDTPDDPESPWPLVKPGDPVRWTYKVTNTGNTVLTDVSITDDQVEDQEITCNEPGDGNTIPELGVGDEVICEATGIAQEGEYQNTGTAVGFAPADLGEDGNLRAPQVVEDNDPSHYFGALSSLGLVKTVNTADANESPGPNISIGESVVWHYTVTNTGLVPISDIVVTDDQLTSEEIICPEGSNAVSVLEVGESVTCQAEGTATKGQYRNLGLVSGTAPQTHDVDGELVDGEEVSATDPAYYFGAQTEVGVVKTINGQVHDEAPGLGVKKGDLMRFNYYVTNIGNVVLTNLVIEDDQGVEVTCPAGEGNQVDSLGVGETIICLGSATADFEGTYTNIGSVTATGPGTLGPEGNDLPGKEAAAESSAFAHIVAEPSPTTDGKVPPAKEVPTQYKPAKVTPAALSSTGANFAGIWIGAVLLLVLGGLIVTLSARRNKEREER